MIFWASPSWGYIANIKCLIAGRLSHNGTQTISPLSIIDSHLSIWRSDTAAPIISLEIQYCVESNKCQWGVPCLSISLISSNSAHDRLDPKSLFPYFLVISLWISFLFLIFQDVEMLGFYNCIVKTLRCAPHEAQITPANKLKAVSMFS